MHVQRLALNRSWEQIRHRTVRRSRSHLQFTEAPRRIRHPDCFGNKSEGGNRLAGSSSATTNRASTAAYLLS